MKEKLKNNEYLIFRGEGDALEVSISSKPGLIQRIEVVDEHSALGEISFQGNAYQVVWLATKSESLKFKKVLDIIEGEDIPLGQGHLLCRALGQLWQRFDYKSTCNILLPYIFSKDVQLSLSDNVTFYGGSFHPWHKGHSECLRLCPEKDIIVVPDSNPWKSKEDQLHCPYWERMKEIAFKLKETPHAVFPGFWGMPEGNPTVQWFPSFHASKKNLLMGADTFMGLRSWFNVSELLSSVVILYVVPRLVDKSEIILYMEKINQDFPNIRMELLDSHPYEHLSSSFLRK